MQTIARTKRWWEPTKLGAFAFDYCINAMRVDHRLPQEYQEDAWQYREMIKDMVDNYGDPPLEKWKSERPQNSLIQSIMTKIPGNDVAH